jgi:uncharacterized protein YndB with AHSA1/START domain
MGENPMTETLTDRPDSRELVFDRLLAAPRAAVWRCWTEPDLLKQWFCPAPWRLAETEVDLRPGGAFNTTMRGPVGEEHHSDGIWLEVVPGRRLVFTDAYSAGWQPAAEPFFTGIVSFDDEGAGTRYAARARHWSGEACARHAEMGFHEGWGRAADQLEALARTL